MRTIINLVIFGSFIVSGSTLKPGDELIDAVFSGDRELVSRLLAEGADVNHVDNRGYSALMIASGWGMAEIVAILIRSGASLNQITETNSISRTPLLAATGNGQTEVTRLLLLS